MRKGAEPLRQMHFQALAIARAFEFAPKPLRQMHFQALAIARAFEFTPKQLRQMHFPIARHMPILGV